MTWSAIVDAGRDLVLHDALCPMTPAAFLVECLEQARSHGRPVLGVRPVTDTVKVVRDGRLDVTVDRDRLHAVASPLVIPAPVLADLPSRPSSDLVQAVAELAAAGHRVVPLTAPPEGRRVATPEDVRLLAALTRPSG